MMLKVVSVTNVLVGTFWSIMSVFSPRLVLISFVQNMSTHIALSALSAVTCSITDAGKLIQTAQNLTINSSVVFNVKMGSKLKEFHVCQKIDVSLMKFKMN